MAENMAWYRKYRPSSMDDYIGDGIKRVVKARFTKPENRPNVIMAHGNRGSGKTTFARIISKYYLCENPIDGEPCNQCETCRTINDVLIAGETGVEVPGVTEIDATTANGKDAIQNIIEDAVLAPLYTKYKVLIIDEAHMITPQAQNSLLKVIEDIPPHLVVIFATTAPEKVLGTIHSRCQLKIEVKKTSVDDMANRLLYIAKQEGVKTSLEALKIIVKKADRVPREAINLFEDIAKTYGNVVTIDNVRERTGDVAAEIYMNYFIASNKSLEDILIYNKKLKELNITYRDFISGLTRFVLDSMYIKHAIALEDYPVEYIKRVKEIFKIYNSNEFDMLLQILENASKMVGEDEAKNELIITTTALRIGKLPILVSKLNNESLQAEKENKKSIQAYKSILETEIKDNNAKVNAFKPTKEKLASILKGMTDIKADNNNVVIPLQDLEIESDNNEDDEYFSQDTLENLLND